jgi:hypothetical protein
MSLKVYILVADSQRPRSWLKVLIFKLAGTFQKELVLFRNSRQMDAGRYMVYWFIAYNGKFPRSLFGRVSSYT